MKAFGAAAVRAKSAGFDVIAVHTVHGYLLNGFLSSQANQRTDEYGGSHENRYRIVREVIDAARAEWKGLMFVRILSTDYKESGRVMSAPGTQQTKAVALKVRYERKAEVARDHQWTWGGVTS